MPKEFDACVREGGRVRTQTVDAAHYRRICFPGGGKPAAVGHVATKKKTGSR